MKIIFNLIVLIIILSACEVDVSPAEPQVYPYPVKDILFSNLDCNMPCWEELDGLSNDSQVSDYFQEEYTDFQHYMNDNMYSFYYGTNEISMLAYTFDDLLYGIDLASPRYFDVSLDDILENLHEPENIQFFVSSGVETRNIFPSLILYYPTDGFVFHFNLPSFQRTDDSETAEVCLDGEELISALQIVRSDTIENMLLVSEQGIITHIPRLTIDELNDFVDDMEEWKRASCYEVGFGFS